MLQPVRAGTIGNAVSVVVAPLLVATSPSVVLVGAGDPGSSRLVYAMVIGLAVIGVVLTFIGVWIVRQTRTDLEVLAPLERMGDSDWKKKDRSTQRRMLDEVRPEGARPLDPVAGPPGIDEEFEQSEHPVTSFSDLGPGVSDEHVASISTDDEASTIGPDDGGDSTPTDVTAMTLDAVDPIPQRTANEHDDARESDAGDPEDGDVDDEVAPAADMILGDAGDAGDAAAPDDEAVSDPQR